MENPCAILCLRFASEKTHNRNSTKLRQIFQNCLPHSENPSLLPYWSLKLFRCHLQLHQIAYIK